MVATADLQKAQVLQRYAVRFCSNEADTGASGRGRHHGVVAGLAWGEAGKGNIERALVEVEREGAVPQVQQDADD